MPAEAIVYPALGLAIIITFFSYMVVRRQHYHLNEPLGKGEWNFKESWATNVTVLGSLFCTIVAQYAEQQKQKYAGLSLFFGILIILAPLLYNTLARGYTIDTPTGAEKVQYLSPLWAFLLTAALTLWAVFGQLLTEMSFLVGISQPSQPSQPPPPFASVSPLLILVMVLAVVLVAVQAVRTVLRTVHEQVSPESRQHRAMALHTSMMHNGRGGVAGRNPHELRPEQPAVPIL